MIKKGGPLPPNNLAFFDFLAECSEEMKKEEPSKYDGKFGIDPFLEHLDDFFHPENFYNQMRSFPTPGLCRQGKLEASRLLAQGKESDAARLLVLSQATLFQHQLQLQYAKRIARKDDQASKKNSAKKDEEEDGDREGEESFEEVQKRLMRFASFESLDLEEMLKDLPSSWTIVQIGAEEDPLLSRFKTTSKDLPGPYNPSLLLVRLSSGYSPVVRRAPGPPAQACRPYLAELQDILATNTHVNKNVKVKSKYWQLRGELDSRMQAFVSSVERVWLGHHRWMLLGQLEDEEVKKGIQELVRKHLGVQEGEQMKKIVDLLSASPFLSSSEVCSSLSSFTSVSPTDSEVSRLVSDVTSEFPSLPSLTRHPILLLADPSLQALPWESLPSLTSCRQAVGRLPSLPFLAALNTSLRRDSLSTLVRGVQAEKVFYVLNPDSNLPDTEARLDKAFQEYQAWEGLKGTKPTKNQLEKVLQAKDCFMYCGHGSGSKYLSGDDVEKLRVRAVPLLLGCSSVRLERLGRMCDPLGTAHSYLIAASPGLLGFLYPCTDADTDQWTVGFLTHWLGAAQVQQEQEQGQAKGEGRLLQAVADRRATFRNFINSCGLVVYGLPLSATGDM